MSPYAAIKCLAILVLVIAAAWIAVGIVKSSPAFALAGVALALSQATIISLASQLERKPRR